MIEADKLCMRYGPVLALDDATFTVGKGEVVGLLGPNGAGKSTTMKILTTYLAPTSGTARVGGFSVEDEPIRARALIGYLPENLPLYVEMEVAEYLEFAARARGLAGDRARERLAWVRERCGLVTVWRTPIRFLSKGFRQRTALAQALIHDPEVVILDEPTSGLDPHQILEIRGLVRELASDKTVILSTHILQEAEAMADRIVVIHQGRIAGQGTLEDLRRQTNRAARVRFTVKTSRANSEAPIRGLSGVRDRELVDERDGLCHYVLYGPDEREIVQRAGLLAKDKAWQVVELRAAPFTLEETFLALTAPPAAPKADDSDGDAKAKGNGQRKNGRAK